MEHDYWQELQEHSSVKHQILEKYLVAWIRKLGSAHRRLLYVDGFAGKGRQEDGSLGSPLIAIEVAKKEYEGEFLCIFIESNKETFEDLEKVIKSETLPPHIHTEVIHSEFADVASAILDRVEKEGYYLAPSFWFIDPFGMKGVPLTLIKRILQNKWAEIFFRFYSNYISRFLTSPYHERALKEMYDSDCWQEATKLSGEERDLKLRDLYIRCLKEKGIARFANSFQVSMPRVSRTAYHLIHATNHFDGFKIMKDIMYSAGTPGTFAYLGSEEGQLQLFSESENLAGFKKYLINRFRGRPLSFTKILEESYEETNLIEKHYRQVLKDMENESPPRIRIERITSKKTGLKGDDLVTFS